MRCIGLVAGILSVVWPSSGSASLLAPAGVDTIPPVIASGRVFYDPADPEETSTLEIVYSEPVEWFGAILPDNYTDVNTGQMAFQGFWFPPDRVHIRFPSGFYGFGTCEQVKVVNVRDLTGNQIVDDGVGNVVTFYLAQLLVKGRMSEHMKAHDVPPHQFALEGSVLPLTWSPLCDVELEDADGDSTWAKKVFFSLPCTSATGGATSQAVDLGFSHLCTELEPSANRSYLIDLGAHPDGRDTLDLWWDDDAPPFYTAQDVDAIFRLQAVPPFGAGDSIALGGSELPLSWGEPPPTRLRDDGVPPDDVAADGIFTARVTFPAGTYRDLEFRFWYRASTDSVFSPECPGEPNREVDIDDTRWSTSNPIEMDMVLGDCIVATSVASLPADPPAFFAPPHPNPTRSGTAIAFSLSRTTRVSVDVLDVRGRLVRRLADGVRPAGAHRLLWDGRTEQGGPAPSRVYFVKLAAGDRVAARRVVLTR